MSSAVIEDPEMRPTISLTAEATILQRHQEVNNEVDEMPTHG